MIEPHRLNKLPWYCKDVPVAQCFALFDYLLGRFNGESVMVQIRHSKPGCVGPLTDCLCDHVDIVVEPMSRAL